jgi:hypothetical protein
VVGVVGVVGVVLVEPVVVVDVDAPEAGLVVPDPLEPEPEPELEVVFVFAVVVAVFAVEPRPVVCANGSRSCPLRREWSGLT